MDHKKNNLINRVLTIKALQNMEKSSCNLQVIINLQVLKFVILVFSTMIFTRIKSTNDFFRLFRFSLK